MLLTLKTGSTPPPPGDFEKGGLLNEQRKRVQSLADTFWSNWKCKYFDTLQCRLQMKPRKDKSQARRKETLFCLRMSRQRGTIVIAVITKTFPSNFVVKF